MQFTTLKLAGFKSFVDPTEFRIETGVTGVVGPNGCGKSNLLEALRWVMGANSAKAMRAGAMDDVIFSGTGKRPSRNHASVVLTIDNKDRTAPSQFNDADVLEISRTIKKGAGSSYQINHTDCRARDVQLLFADASTGANSPALVRQGQINELIAAKPQNRRKVLEEAAGISGLHTRRHEAELRLRAAETNLGRLADIRVEIEAQYQQVKRQVRAASRYKNLASEIRALEAFSWVLRWNEVEASLQQTNAELQELEQELGELSAVSARTLAASEQATGGMDDLRKEQAIAQALVARMSSARENVERDAQEARSRIAALGHRLEETARDLQHEQSLASDAANSIVRLSKEQDELVAADDNPEQLQVLEREAIQLRDTLLAKELVLEKLTRKQAEQRAIAQNAESQIQVSSDRVQRFSDELREASSEQSELAGTTSNLDELAQLESAKTGAEADLQNLRQQTSQAEAKLQTTETEEHEARSAYDTAARQKDQLLAEQAALQKVLAQSSSDKWQAVSEAMEVAPGYERALTVALGDDLQASTQSDAPAVWLRLRKSMPGFGKEVQPLNELVSAPDELALRLSQIGVVNDAIGEKLAPDLRAGQRLVTREGRMWRWDGYCVKAEAPCASTLRLEQKNRLTAMQPHVEKANTDTKRMRENWENCKQVRGDSLLALKELRQQVPALEQRIRIAQDSWSAAQTSSIQHNSRLESVLQRIGHWETELSSAEQELVTAQKAARDIPQEEIDADIAAVNSAREQRDEARSFSFDAEAALRGVQREQQARASRIKAINDEINEWQQRSSGSTERVASLNKRQKDTELRLNKARAAPDEINTRRTEIFAKCEQAESRLAGASDALASAESTLREAQHAARDAESAAARAREHRAALQAKKESAEERRDEVKNGVREALDCEPSELQFDEDGLKKTPLNANEAEIRLHKLRRERDNIGGVNLQAEEQSEELAQRLDLMQADQDELEAAIAKLRKGVDSLNKEGRTRLLAAFETINGHFKSLFLTLFGGGEAELRLTESDDPLAAGLEIFASPPGKKLGSMSLLSGGEQALTAMALIFAVFRSNPAPVCVLDEVDAPLDDANVERLCAMLDEMRERTETRFVVITHNPLTMSRVDRLYGVTMAERGVSQLVSVDLQRAEDMIAAE